MKIAKVFVGDPNNQKGYFNNVMERTRQLLKKHKDVDCYIIRIYFDFFLRFLKRDFNTIKKEEYTVIDGILFKNIWISLSWYDYISTYRLHRKVISSKKKLNTQIRGFEKYDILSIHGVEAIYLATQVKQKYCVPFVSTWHGSDINIVPFYNDYTKQEIKIFLDSAEHNFFVSEKLMDVALTISSKPNKQVFYTGPSSAFYRYNKYKVDSLRAGFGLTSKYVVGFIGNLVQVKNVLVLPLIFAHLQKKFNEDISFIIVGNGVLEKKIKKYFREMNVRNVFFFGKQAPNKIPDFMNCINVLVLPSLNEGLPRVTLEAQACGVHVVGSDRGGIPEAIGAENCFALEDNFVERISKRIMAIIEDKELKPILPEKFSWDAAVSTEIQVYRNSLMVNSK